ncbi:hypothetical protein M5689_013250 [Euphorbia peplus]|nr:hypothetical protein M5689_013250 [Euphorbia peplus]
MESASEDENKQTRRRRRGRGGEESNLYTSIVKRPLYYFQKLVKYLLTCLGCDPSTPALAQAERGNMKMKEDTQMQIRRQTVAKKPPRPPVSSGGGAHIN